MNPKSVLVLLAVLLAGGCASQHREGRVTHVVVCWLKSPGDAAARAKLIEECAVSGLVLWLKGRAATRN